MIYYRNDSIDETVILGNSFFENYYVIWDFDKMKLGFNGYFEIYKPPIPPLPQKKGFPAWATVLIILVGIGAVSAISWYLYNRYKQ